MALPKPLARTTMVDLGTYFHVCQARWQYSICMSHLPGPEPLETDTAVISPDPDRKMLYKPTIERKRHRIDGQGAS